MNIENRQIKELIPADYNPRQLSEKQFADLKESMETFGQMEPAIVNTHEGREGIIVSGHQRIKVAESLGHSVYPCIEVSLPLEKEKQLNIRMNKNSGSWDFDQLANMFDADDLKNWGFEDWEMGMVATDVDLDEFFEESESDESKPEEEETKITLKYTKEEYAVIIEKFASMDGSKEKIVWELLQL